MDLTPDCSDNLRQPLPHVLGAPRFDADLDGDMPRTSRARAPQLVVTLKPDPPLLGFPGETPASTARQPAPAPQGTPLWVLAGAGGLTGLALLLLAAVFAFGAAALVALSG